MTGLIMMGLGSMSLCVLLVILYSMKVKEITNEKAGPIS